MKSFVLFLLLLPFIWLNAQNSAYYPLAKGNQWDFAVSGGPILQPDYSIIITGDTIMPDGYKYAVKMKKSVTGVISLYSFERFANDTVYSYKYFRDEPIWYFFKKDTVIADIYDNKNSQITDMFLFYCHQFKRWNKEFSARNSGRSGTYYTDSIGYSGSYNINIEYSDIRTLTAAIINGRQFGKPRYFTSGLPKGPEDVIIEYNLLQNYPNPFNPTTAISYSIPVKSYVLLKIFDILGHEVTTLISKEQNAGEYKVQFNASGLSGGVYIYTLQAGRFRQSRKLLLLK